MSSIIHQLVPCRGASLAFFILTFSSLNSSSSLFVAVRIAAFTGIDPVHIGGGAFLRGQLSGCLPQANLTLQSPFGPPAITQHLFCPFRL